MMEKKTCEFCKCEAPVIEDTAKQRIYECRSCFAVNVISKGDGSWWYFGWEHPDGRRVNADGQSSVRPSHMKFGWWDNLAA